MTYQKPHFIWDSSKPEVDAFAAMMRNEFGDVAFEDADLRVAIGGDGTLLDLLDRSIHDHVPVYGVTVPGSASSRGFLTDHDVRNAADLIARLEQAHMVRIPALAATYILDDGEEITKYTYNDVNIKSTSLDRFQAAQMHVRAQFNDAASEGFDFMGDGLIIATPIASTGYNKSNGGSSVSLLVPALTLSGISTIEPSDLRTNTPVLPLDTHIHVTPKLGTYDKRPLGILVGGSGTLYSAEKDGRAITDVHVRVIPEKEGRLLVSRHPSSFAVRALKP